eukprot:2928932-Rhodomonas_salina.1
MAQKMLRSALVKELAQTMLRSRSLLVKELASTTLRSMLLNSRAWNMLRSLVVQLRMGRKRARLPAAQAPASPPPALAPTIAYHTLIQHSTHSHHGRQRTLQARAKTHHDVAFRCTALGRGLRVAGDLDRDRCSRLEGPQTLLQPACVRQELVRVSRRPQRQRRVPLSSQALAVGIHSTEQFHQAKPLLIFPLLVDNANEPRVSRSCRRLARPRAATRALIAAHSPLVARSPRRLLRTLH